MKLLLLTSVLPADTAAASNMRSALDTATQPLNLDVKRWFGHEQLEAGLNALINFGLRVLLVLLLFWLGRIVIRRLQRLIDGILRRRQLDGVAVTLLDSLFSALCYIALGLTLAGILGVKSVSFAAVLASMGLPAAEPRRWGHHHGHEALRHRCLHLRPRLRGYGARRQALPHRGADAR